ncbi:carbonic anhydrase [Desulfurispirillum indicum]|uniref:Carbonic anhydrase n=1 Tax=Desulfurispirillum indicum (strain ATCC BAA-1389 / DSM 22839 / S5) TaxID=653733 RepID=E6W4J8_DESIS|nr:carbonic anhydrase [Desulfurispirillum indicum]ADU67071.1 Carbonate dehydratase [Desulfurispirillum indicum S5]UCZ56390.1 carbonic anhydrase [Desulfurispirillum indicum]
MKDIEGFISGFKRFQNTWLGSDKTLFDELREGQSPKAMLIGCSDSRVDPAILTDCLPGELFIVRNVANLVPPCRPDEGHHGVSAALEYAVCHLNVEHIIVLGHSQCGGIKGLMDGICECSKQSFIGSWVGIAQAAKEKVLKELSHKPVEVQNQACEKAAILLSLENLLSFPWIKERVENGSLELHGWYFDLQAGTLSGLSQETGNFIPLA